MAAHQTKPPNPLPDEGLDVRDKLTKEKGMPVKDLIAIPLHDGDPQHIIQIGSQLNNHFAG